MTNDLETKGFDLFREKQFWEAHESLEILWKQSSGDSKLFYQALILLSAAFLKTKEDQQKARERLFCSALEKFNQISNPRFRAPEWIEQIQKRDHYSTWKLHQAFVLLLP